jgi:hypothetical protein
MERTINVVRFIVHWLKQTSPAGENRWGMETLVVGWRVMPICQPRLGGLPVRPALLHGEQDR